MTFSCLQGASSQCVTTTAVAGIHPKQLLADYAAAMQARTMTFHVDPNKMGAVMHTLDETIARLSAQEGFKGLLCLQMGGGARQRITIISLWEPEGLEATSSDVEEVREHVIATLDLGASIQTHEVVRLLPGPQTPI